MPSANLKKGVIKQKKRYELPKSNSYRPSVQAPKETLL